MATIASLAVSLVAKIGGFEKDMKRAQRIVSNFGSDIYRHTKTIAAYGTAIAGVAAGATAVLVKQQMQAIDSTSKLSRVIGLTTEQLVGYQHAASLAGVDSEAFAKGIVRMNRTIADAGAGLSTAKRELDRVGLSAEMLAGMSTDQRIKLLADRYNSIGDAAARSSFLMNVFGRSGIGIGGLFEQGAEGIAKAQQEAEALGLTFDKISGLGVENANDAIERAQKAVTGLATRIAVQLAPFIEVAANRLRDFAMQWNTSGDAATNAFDFIARGMGKILNVIDALKGAWDAFMAGVLTGAATIANLNPVTGPARLARKVIEKITGKDMGPANAFDAVIDGFEKAAAEAAERSNEAFGRIFTGENTKKAQDFFKGVQIDAAKAADELREMMVPDVGEAGIDAADSMKAAEFRQVDLNRIAIGGPSAKGSKQMVEDPQLKTTNSILREIQISIGSPLVTA